MSESNKSSSGSSKLVHRIISDAIHSKPSIMKQRISCISKNSHQYEDTVNPSTNMTKGEEGRAWIAYGEKLKNRPGLIYSKPESINGN